ncbi:hypothetical protein Bpfe_014761 [Biomphalaria pfeifferi]|uniref:Uncharacterized protein n=1 Tax=Biomphalaria pfeifferi TaxID=112525 RepID=A0AAD8F8S8_BIOPF|nr:hypothetical protein Bpfe_014761 [Biomphalaria pfeifferi]
MGVKWVKAMKRGEGLTPNVYDLVDILMMQILMISRKTNPQLFLQYFRCVTDYNNNSDQEALNMMEIMPNTVSQTTTINDSNLQELNMMEIMPNTVSQTTTINDSNLQELNMCHNYAVSCL